MGARTGPRVATMHDRRKARRYQVTLSAQVTDADRRYRTEVLDVSAGGLLLARPPALSVAVDSLLQIEAPMIGRVQARVVGVSRHGIHLEIEPHTRQYESAIERLSILSQAW